MCEVDSCCGCYTLHKGCVVIGVVTIFVSICQVTLFAWILHHTYLSQLDLIKLNEADNSTVVPIQTGSTNYIFQSEKCPFGFLSLKTSNQTSQDDEVTTTKMITVEVTEAEVVTTIIPTASNSSDLYNGSSYNYNESLYGNDHDLFPDSNIDPMISNCVAPGHGVLWTLVVASALYSIAGACLIVGIRKGYTSMLSLWFFYTVGYNLLGLIIALTDGVYTSAGDISSYVVCFVTGYCVIVVDSFYEKLLSHKKTAGSNPGQFRPSLVLIKSSPPTSPCSSGPPSPIMDNGQVMRPNFSYSSSVTESLLPQRGRETSPA